MNKTCLRCGTSLNELQFSPHPLGRDKLHPWCRQCVRDYDRTRKQGKKPPQQRVPRVGVLGVPMDGSYTPVQRASKGVAGCGVYEIVHVPSGRRYVGASKDLQTRFRQHRTDLRRGIHHCKALQDAWSGADEGCFEFVVSCACAPEDLEAFERALWLARRRENTFFNDPHAYKAGSLARKK